MGFEYSSLKNEPFFWREGDHACLLLHGLGGGVYAMQWLGERLRAAGWTVMGINHPGHDRPAKKMPPSTWDQWYANVERAYDQLAQDYSDITIIGFSTGCPLALHLANQKSASDCPVQQLVLLGPYLQIRYHWYYGFPLETYVNILGNIIKDLPRLKLPIRDRQMEKLASQASFFQTFNMTAVQSAIKAIETLVKPSLSKITIPTYIIQGEQDSVVDPAGAQLVFDSIQSTTKDLVWLPESDHIMTLDLEREQVYEQVLQWLSHSLSS